jgi:multisubunit Na+/H+ antiporter MnhC subunit
MNKKLKAALYTLLFIIGQALVVTAMVNSVAVATIVLILLMLALIYFLYTTVYKTLKDNE